MPTKPVCVGVVIAAHGIKGRVKVKSFTDPPDALQHYQTLQNKQGQPLKIVHCTFNRNIARIEFAAIDNRDAAEALCGTEIYVPRETLPPLEDDDFYHADLIGLTVFDAAGTQRGVVTAIYNFGAGDVVEIGDELIPFTKAHIPHIDIAAGRMVIGLLNMDEM